MNIAHNNIDVHSLSHQQQLCTSPEVNSGLSKPLLTQVMTELVASQSGLVPRPAALGGIGLDGKIIEV